MIQNIRAFFEETGGSLKLNQVKKSISSIVNEGMQLILICITPILIPIGMYLMMVYGIAIYKNYRVLTNKSSQNSDLTNAKKAIKLSAIGLGVGLLIVVASTVLLQTLSLLIQ